MWPLTDFVEGLAGTGSEYRRNNLGGSKACETQAAHSPVRYMIC